MGIEDLFFPLIHLTPQKKTFVHRKGTNFADVKNMYTGCQKEIYPFNWIFSVIHTKNSINGITFFYLYSVPIKFGFVSVKLGFLQGFLWLD